MAAHSSILAWKIPWTEEPGRLQSHGVAKSQTRLSDFKKQKLTSLGFLGHFRKEGKTGERKIDVREYPHTL